MEIMSKVTCFECRKELDESDAEYDAPDWFCPECYVKWLEARRWDD